MGISNSKGSNNLIVKNKQLRNLKIERLFITFITKFVIMIFAILPNYREHYPSSVNYKTFLINSVSLEISTTTSLTLSLHSS